MGFSDLVSEYMGNTVHIAGTILSRVSCVGYVSGSDSSNG